MCNRRGQWIEWGYSGLTNEKPWNSSWSRLAISSWSGGVSSGGWRVKKRSKFSASRPHCGGERRRERDGERERGGERMAWIWWSEGCREKMDTKQTKRKKRERQLKPTNQISHSRDCGFPLVHMKANDISASIIGYYTHKWQVGICESSEQWQVMVDERATLTLTSNIFLLWREWESECTHVCVCVCVSVMNTLTALGLKGGWTSLFCSFSQSI